MQQRHPRKFRRCIVRYRHGLIDERHRLYGDLRFHFGERHERDDEFGYVRLVRDGLDGFHQFRHDEWRHRYGFYNHRHSSLRRA
jgi:hypothetical protein